MVSVWTVDRSTDRNLIRDIFMLQLDPCSQLGCNKYPTIYVSYNAGGKMKRVRRGLAIRPYMLRLRR